MVSLDWKQWWWEVIYRGFVAASGLAICAISVAGIIVESIPDFFLDACTGAT